MRQNTESELSKAKSRVIDAREELKMFPDDESCQFVYALSQVTVIELEEELEIVDLNCP